MNAQAEFLSHIMEAPDVKAVTIMFNERGYSSNPEHIKIFNLREGFTEDDFKKFIEDLDFDYDNGFGTQYLFGKIWYTDGTWSERYEYDGSESWTHQGPTDIFYYDMKYFEDAYQYEKQQEEEYLDEEERRLREEMDRWDGDESDKIQY